MDWSNLATKTNIYRENVMLFFHVNKSWMHNDVIWRHTFWPTLNRVMSRCQMVPSHYLNQCWVIVYWVLRNKLQWNLNQITKLFFYKNTYENVALEITQLIQSLTPTPTFGIKYFAYFGTHLWNMSSHHIKTRCLCIILIIQKWLGPTCCSVCMQVVWFRSSHYKSISYGIRFLQFTLIDRENFIVTCSFYIYYTYLFCFTDFIFIHRYLQKIFTWIILFALIILSSYIFVLHMWSLRAGLTHWGRDKMNATSQTTSSNAFSWMKMSEFRLRFHWSLFLRVQLTIFQHWFR